jgi:hypothetical protein
MNQNVALAPQTTVRDYNRFLEQSLESADAERRAMLQRFDDLSTAQQGLGDVRLELNDKCREVQELQRLLHEQRLVVQEEREKSARVVSENLVMRSQCDDDRLKIEALLNMRRTELAAAPTAAAAPIMLTVNRKGGADAPSSIESLSLRRVASPHSSGVSTCAAGMDASSMAVHTPAASTLVAALGKEVMTLKQLIEEQREAYETDRAVRVADDRRREQQHHDTVTRHSSTIDHLQTLLNEATKQLCTYRHDAQIRERHLRGDNEGLVTRTAESERLLAVERARHTSDLRVAVESHTAKSDNVSDQLRLRVREKDKKHALECDQMARTIEGLRATCAATAEVLGKERRERQRLAQKLKFDAAGRQSDVNLMRQQLRIVEKKIFFHGDPTPEPQQPQHRRSSNRKSATSATSSRRATQPLAEHDDGTTTEEHDGAVLPDDLLAAHDVLYGGSNAAEVAL